MENNVYSEKMYDCTAQEYYYQPFNVSRSTVSGIAAYRSALTLDWIAAEDSRQREMVRAFETEAAPPIRILATECVMYSRPASGKVARLMLELLKNLEGDEGTIITELIQALVRSKLLVETSMLESEPDLEALVKTPDVMMGEPHTTFPRILAMTWLAVTDPTTTKKYGWCPVNKITKYLGSTKSVNIANHMRALDPIVARARYIMEEFIQHVTPLNMFEKQNSKKKEAVKNYKIDDRNGIQSGSNRPIPLDMAVLSTPKVDEIKRISDIFEESTSCAVKLLPFYNFIVLLFIVLNDFV